MKLSSLVAEKLPLICVLALVECGCDRLREFKPAKTQPKEPVAVTESVELSMDSILDGMLFFNRTDFEKAQKEGRSNVLPPLDGNWWLKMNPRDRAIYLGGIRDLVWLIWDVTIATRYEVDKQTKTKNLEYVFGDSTTLMASLVVNSEFNRRLLAVLGAGTGVDISDAVTKFYSNKPLLKDKPVLW